MKENLHHLRVRQAKIHKSVYRSSNLARFIRFVASVLISGQSPIEHRPSYNRRK